MVTFVLGTGTTSGSRSVILSHVLRADFGSNPISSVPGPFLILRLALDLAEGWDRENVSSESLDSTLPSSASSSSNCTAVCEVISVKTLSQCGQTRNSKSSAAVVVCMYVSRHWQQNICPHYNRQLMVCRIILVEDIATTHISFLWLAGQLAADATNTLFFLQCSEHFIHLKTMAKCTCAKRHALRRSWDLVSQLLGFFNCSALLFGLLHPCRTLLVEGGVINRHFRQSISENFHVFWCPAFFDRLL